MYVHHGFWEYGLVARGVGFPTIVLMFADIDEYDYPWIHDPPRYLGRSPRSPPDSARYPRAWRVSDSEFVIIERETTLVEHIFNLGKFMVRPFIAVKHLIDSSAIGIAINQLLSDSLLDLKHSLIDLRAEMWEIIREQRVYDCYHRRIW